MQREEIKRVELIRFIKSNDPFYLFADFSWHTTEQLEKMKNASELETNKQMQMIVENAENKYCTDAFKKVLIQ